MIVLILVSNRRLKIAHIFFLTFKRQFLSQISLFSKSYHLRTCHNKSKNSTDYRIWTWNIAILYARRRRPKFDSKTVSLCGKFGAQLHEISIAGRKSRAAICEISNWDEHGLEVDGEKQLIRPHINARIPGQTLCTRAHDLLHSPVQVYTKFRM